MEIVDLIRFFNLHKLAKPFFGGIGHILMFHRVCNKSDYIITKGLEVSQKYLENVLKYFVSEEIDIVTLDECYNRITAKGKVKRFVAFTFDDGYVDNLTHALPVFEKYNAPFAMFLATGLPDHKAVLWWYLLETLVMNNDTIQFEEGGQHYFYDTSTMDKKRYAFGELRGFILSSNQENLLPRLRTIFNEVFPDLYALTRKLSLSWDQVIELTNHPLVTIGAHTVHHYALSKLEISKVIEEINESVNAIESKTGKPVKHFAYPTGTPNEAGSREFEIAKNCNFKTALIAEKGNVFRYHANHLHSIPRLGINEALRISNIDLFINGLTPLRDKYFT